MQRFFVPSDCIHQNEVTLPQQVQKQLGRVLRLQTGDRILALTGDGYEYLLELEKIAGDNFIARIASKEKNRSEARLRLTLFIALTQREKFEWILQKGTEVGLAAFQPFVSARSLVQQGFPFEKKRLRWQAILREAAEQCGRGRLPELFDPLPFQATLKAAQEQQALNLAAWEGEQEQDLKQALAGFPDGDDERQIGVFVGPEGGFESEEADSLRRAGVRLFSLGARILRMETAAILAPALILFQLGEMRRRAD